MQSGIPFWNLFNPPIMDPEPEKRTIRKGSALLECKTQQ